MIHIYIYIWVNYNDLTATSLESWLGFGESSPNGPTIIQQFRLVKYYNLPRYIYIYTVYIHIITIITIMIYNDTHIYIYIHIYIWVNYNDLTATSLESWLGFGESSPNGPTIIQQFRLVKYYNLPRYIYIYTVYIHIITIITIMIYNDTHIYIYIYTYG